MRTMFLCIYSILLMTSVMGMFNNLFQPKCSTSFSTSLSSASAIAKATVTDQKPTTLTNTDTKPTAKVTYDKPKPVYKTTITDKKPTPEKMTDQSSILVDTGAVEELLKKNAFEESVFCFMNKPEHFLDAEEKKPKKYAKGYTKTDDTESNSFSSDNSESILMKMENMSNDKSEVKMEHAMNMSSDYPREHGNFVYVQNGSKSDEIRFGLQKFINIQADIDASEKELLKSAESYCMVRKTQLSMNDVQFAQFKENCDWEYLTVTTMKSIYGNNIRIVKKRSPYAPEFLDFSTPYQESSPTFTLVLHNLEGIAKEAYDYNGYIRISDPIERAALDDKIKKFIARLHKVPKNYVQNMKISRGSIKAQYQVAAPSGDENTNVSIRNQLNTPPSHDQDRVPETDTIVPDTSDGNENISPAYLDPVEAEKLLKRKNFKEMQIHDAFFMAEFSVRMFDRDGHKNFKNESYLDWDKVGGKKYITPTRGKWMRMGLAVFEKYGRDDKTWLHPFQHENNWVRGYHGMGHSSEDNFKVSKKIIRSGGLKIGTANVYGRGVYWSDNPEMTSYDGKGTGGDGNEYFLKLMCAIYPQKYTPENKKGYEDDGGHYYHCPNEEDIRIYGILIRPVN